MRSVRRAAWCLPLLLSPSLGAAQGSLDQAMRSRIDSVVTNALRRTGAPSASIAVVRGGRLVYAHAYGDARLEPALRADTSMRYSIGSISKQFTATAMLLLAERGKVSLDDPVARWLPELTRAKDVTVRQLLSMTSGYQDYWPQDYVMPPMLQSTTARFIVDTWGRKPLDFEPGTRWQYSNTNYVIAGMIIEKASGMPLVEFLRREIFTPLGMTSIQITDEGALGPTDPERYRRFALGPARVAPKEGRGWMFAAGELAMTASDLARWDMSVIAQRILKPASYRDLETTVLLSSGLSTGYGLGVNVSAYDGHRMISHGGEVSGFTAQNMVFPDDSVAVVALVNLDATGAPGQIAAGIRQILFDVTDAETPRYEAEVRRIFEGLQKGELDRSRFSANLNAYFSDQAIADFKASLGPMGTPTAVRQTRQTLRGGMTYRGFQVVMPGGTVSVSTFILPDGTFEQFQVAGG